MNAILFSFKKTPNRREQSEEKCTLMLVSVMIKATLLIAQNLKFILDKLTEDGTVKFLLKE